MKKLLLLFMLWSFSFSVFAQVNYTANDQVTPYTGLFRPGINFDYYPPYTGKDLANIAAGNPALNLPGIGSRTSRPALFENFAENWGYDYLLSDFQHFQSLGMEDLTMIVGFPAEWHRDQTYYCDGADPMHAFCGNDPYNPDCKSNMFANLYTPIWDGGANGTPYNDDNYLAAYMYKLVTNYKDYVKFWEIWNEPGFDHSFVQGWQQPGGPNNWWDNDPSPCVNHFHAPIEHYVRTLRICYDVVKTVDPDAYVAVAGVGFESFLDAILRNTDNPVDGSVTPEYPNGGGAYFDVMGFHTYPDIDGSVRDFVNGQWVYTRNSDKAAQGVPKRKNAYQAILAQYGYDGVIHPKKEWIITEINTPRVPFNPSSMASDESQTNYITKAVVAAMKNDIRQIHPYQLADRKTVANATGEFDLLGMYYNFTNTQPYTNLNKTNEGIAYTTTSKFIFGSTYDAAKTAAMNLPNNIDGGAFYDAANNRYKYIIWAKATLDLSEAASANYSFPSSFGLTTINKRLWDWSETGTTTDVSPNNIALTARPIYLTDAPDPGKGNLVLTCPDDIHVNLPQGAGNVTVTWNDATAFTTCPTSSTASVTQTAGMTSGSAFWMGTHTVSYGAFDQCSNTANCSFDIIVGSNTNNSTINTICPANISVTAASGANTATASWATPTATTTCATSANVTITQTSGSPSGGNFTIGTHDIVYTYTDQCGTSTTCSFTVTVNPSSTASCGNISGFTKLGEYNGHGYYISTADWNWQDGSSFASQSGGYLATINDAAENDYLQSILSEMAFIGLYDLNVEGSVEWDNGEPVSYTNYSTSCPWCHANGPDFDFAVMLPWDGSWVFENQWVNRPIVMELDCGGTPAGDLTITSCPSNIVQTLATGTNQMAISWPTPTATTTCSTATDITVSQTTGPSSGSNFDAGTYNISYTLSDQCNNSANCSFSVTVNTSSTGGTCDAIPGFTKLGELNGKGYYISDLEMTWGAAHTVASANGSFVSISSQEENDFIANLISDIVFIGFSDAATEGTVVWDNGDALSYTNYSTCDWCGLNTAENDYGVMLPWNGEWSFNNQWVYRKFILETTCGGSTGTGCPSTIAGYTNLGDFNGHNYYLSNNPLNWDAANTAATNDGGYLATMNDQAENDFLQSNLGNQLVFIGYNDASTEGTGAWANGETVTLDLSYSNDPDNDFGIMNFWAGTWQMVNQWVAKPYVMEMNCSGASPAPIAPQMPQVAPGVKLIAMYPNPADDFITARMISGSDVEVTFTIISAQGQAKTMTINQLTKGPNEVDFDIHDLQPGMYFLKATGKNVNQVIRFVKMN